jgi:nucleotide-binding universal stress UspA family protein
MRILVAVDDSPHAQAAIAWVKSMRWPAGTRVRVLSVMRPQINAVSEVYVPAAPYEQAMWDELHRHHETLAAQAERTLQTPGLETDAHVLVGDPRVAIVDEARSTNADLVVVGSHGRSGVAKLLMGSVATHVVTHAPCSVMVIKLPQDARKAA